jgi:hypothetical protein
MTSTNSTTVEQRWIKLRVPSRSESPKVKEFLAIHNYPVYHLERVPDDAQLLQGFIVHKYSSMYISFRIKHQCICLHNTRISADFHSRFMMDLVFFLKDRRDVFYNFLIFSNLLDMKSSVEKFTGENF